MAYRSGFERQIAASLNSRGVGFKYEPFSLPFMKLQRLTKKVRELHGLESSFKNYTYHFYTPDFVLLNGIIIEAKGRFTAAMRTLILAVIKYNPEKDIRLVFQRDNKLNPGSRSKYSDWCKKHGIKYSIGRVPDAWVSE